MRHVKIITLCAGLALLAGCDVPGLDVQAGAPEAAAFSSVVVESDRIVDSNFRDIAFAEGRVAVVAEEHGRMRTYWLVPCQDGTRICAGGLNGRAGSLTLNPDFSIVSGAYRGRDFYLSPGGDGVLITRDGQYQLAWE